MAKTAIYLFQKGATTVLVEVSGIDTIRESDPAGLRSLLKGDSLAIALYILDIAILTGDY
jgi:hypothetical protein